MRLTRCVVPVLLAFLPVASLAAVSAAEVRQLWPGAGEVRELDGRVPAARVSGDKGAVVYALSTASVTPISAYSGKPIDALVLIDEAGKVQALRVVHHEEPILVIGIGDADLQAFVDQFVGTSAAQRVRVGAHNREGYYGIDGISGATITSMVLASSISQSVAKVSSAYGLSPEMASAQLAETEPAWQQLWRDRRIELAVVSIALVMLLGVLFFQDWLVKHTLLFHRFRVGYLLFTVFFIGFFCSGQLSVLNLLAFFRSLTGGFSWDTLLIEPVIFLLWAFVAVSILLWGRGVYCGWLCPFGAAQDLVSKLATRLGFEGYRLPQMVHERLWAIKYLLLIALVGLSLDSMVYAARLAEVEPFKTTFVMKFMREPVFVIYAVALLLVSVINSKFYCKYLCPLGAGLSFVTRFRVFDWLRRRPECGKPCESCAHNCQIAAIKPTGEIIDNECHYCLECQVTYWDDHRCPPLVERRQKRERRAAKSVIARDS